MPYTLIARTTAEYRACRAIWMVLGVPFFDRFSQFSYPEGAALSRHNWRRVLMEKCLYSEEQLPAVEALLENWQKGMERERFVNSRQSA